MKYLSRSLAAVSFLLGVGWFGFVGYQNYYAQASRSWPSTPGEFQDYNDTYNREHQGNLGNRVEVVNERHIYYRYTVAGVQYIGSRISFGWDEHQLPAPGTEAPVTVYYKPRGPSQSVLFPGRSPLPWGLIVFGFALFGLGLVILKIGAKLAESAD